MKRIVLLLVMFALAVQINAQEKARSPEAGQAYNDGRNLAIQKKYDAAIVKFKEAIKADEKFSEAYYMLGYVYKQQKKYGLAEQNLKKAIELDSKLTTAYLTLGNLQSESDNLAALNTFQAVLSYDPDNYKANYFTGQIHYKLKRYSEAERHLKKAIESQPKFSKAFNYLGLTYDAQGNGAMAVQAFQNAINFEKKSSNKGTYYYRLGKVYLGMGKYSNAADALKNALKLSRSSRIKAASNFYMGEAYKKMNQKQKALRYFETAAKSPQWKKAAEYEIDLIKNPDKYAY